MSRAAPRGRVGWGGRSGERQPGLSSRCVRACSPPRRCRVAQLLLGGGARQQGGRRRVVVAVATRAVPWSGRRDGSRHRGSRSSTSVRVVDAARPPGRARLPRPDRNRPVGHRAGHGARSDRDAGKGRQGRRRGRSRPPPLADASPWARPRRVPLPHRARRLPGVTRACLQPAGYVVIATFGPDGPTTCSGLPVVRYTNHEPTAEFPGCGLLSASGEDHETPWARHNSSPPS